MKERWGEREGGGEERERERERKREREREQQQNTCTVSKIILTKLGTTNMLGRGHRITYA